MHINLFSELCVPIFFPCEQIAVHTEGVVLVTDCSVISPSGRKPENNWNQLETVTPDLV